MPRSLPRAATGIRPGSSGPHSLKTTMDSRNILLVSFCLCAVRSRQRESPAGIGQLSQGHRKGAGQGPDRRRAHGAHDAGYPVELPLPRPAAGPDRGAPGRACGQIDRICTHNERTRHDSTAAPNERRDCAPPPPKSDRSTSIPRRHGLGRTGDGAVAHFAAALPRLKDGPADS